MELPTTRYARSGDVSIAYQVFGEGDLDIVVVPGFVSHIELLWEHEPARRFMEELAAYARVLYFDRRGSGLSDPVSAPPTLELRMDDVRAVMDAAGSQRAALIGLSEGVPMSLLFAATYPERTQALVCYGGTARATYADDYPWATPAQALAESAVELLLPTWGDGSIVEVTAPSQADNPDVRAFLGRFQRGTASPGQMMMLAQMFLDLDLRDIVPTVHTPALVLHRRHDRMVNVRNAQWLAEHLPDARLVVARGRRPRPVVRERRGVARRGAGVPHRRPRGARADARPADGAVHGHRRFDAHGGGAGRPPLARAARGSPA